MTEKLYCPTCGVENCFAAAADDVLASLKEMTAALARSGEFMGLNDEEVAMLRRAEAAIAKAEGKQ